jgi:hypothetical protein
MRFVDDLSPSDGGRRALQVVLAVLATIPFARGAVDVLAGSDLLPGGPVLPGSQVLPPICAHAMQTCGFSLDPGTWTWEPRGTGSP